MNTRPLRAARISPARPGLGELSSHGTRTVAPRADRDQISWAARGRAGPGMHLVKGRKGDITRSWRAGTSGNARRQTGKAEVAGPGRTGSVVVREGRPK
ncbi:hypothetical protein J6590_010234 [Homalodisca vitripennis]|nr:hypothetical protein J6590_010234 [Homalodisca vitripennis]